MSAERAVRVQHPEFVHAPDPRLVEGVRAYREPEVPHPLQLTFLEEATERAWIDHVQSLLSEGRSAEAYSLLASELASFNGKLARLCNALSPSDVVIEGWEDLLPILAEWEGPPITGITVGMTNAPDLVFEPGVEHRPDLLINLYSDESFAFTRATKAQILGECAKDVPAWSGAEEDVEFYCTISGLDELNTALVQCKHRHFLRDGRDGVEGRAPGGYVEFQLASWFLAAVFLQSVEQAIEQHGLPDGCRPIVGSIDMNADFACVLGADKAECLGAEKAARSAEPTYASLTVKPWVPKEEVEPLPAANTLRQRIRTAEPEPQSSNSRGFLSRLFGRFSRR